MIDAPPDPGIVARVRKLLALSSSPNEHEAALALQFAQDLMLKHNLKAAELEKLGETAPTPVVEQACAMGARFIWKKRLAAAVAESNYCMALSVGSTLYLVGRADNVAVAREIVTWLIQSLESLVVRARLRGEIASDSTARNNYLHGAVSRITERLTEARRSQDAASTALVLVRDGEVREFIDVHHPRARTVTVRSSLGDRSAYQAGFSDGATVSLSPHKRVGGRKSALRPGRG